MKNGFASILIFSFFFLQSCVYSTQLTSSMPEIASEENATIVVMRTSPFGAAVRNDVYHNGSLVGYTGVRSYLRWDVPPGEHTIGSSAGNFDFEQIEAKPGETYYFKQAQRIGIFIPNVNLMPLENDKAIRKFGKLREPNLVEVLPKSVYSTGE